jgi:hypothetical protein
LTKIHYNQKYIKAFNAKLLWEQGCCECATWQGRKMHLIRLVGNLFFMINIFNIIYFDTSLLPSIYTCHLALTFLIHMSLTCLMTLVSCLPYTCHLGLKWHHVGHGKKLVERLLLHIRKWHHHDIMYDIWC